MAEKKEKKESGRKYILEISGVSNSNNTDDIQVDFGSKRKLALDVRNKILACGAEAIVTFSTAPKIIE